MFRSILLLALCSTTLMSGARQIPGPSEDSITRTLDAFHSAASKAEFDGYFALFAPDAVFLGTDATERWTLSEFKTFARPIFEQGKGWTYTLVEGSRHITIDAGGTTAWFDELLSNAKYGTCRGSGVLRKVGEDWKVAQYNLALMVPNDVANDVVALIKRER